MVKRNFREKSPFKSQQHKGASSEMLAACWLLSKGYDVFRNVSPAGAIDIIAWKHDCHRPELFDVKSITAMPAAKHIGGIYYGAGKPTDRQKELGIEQLYVFPDGEVSRHYPSEPRGRLNPLSKDRDWILL